MMFLIKLVFISLTTLGIVAYGRYDLEQLSDNLNELELN